VSPLRRLLALAVPVRGWILLAVLTSFAALTANVALMTAAPYLISKATVVTGFAALSLTVTAVRALAISRAALRYSERYTVHLAALRILTTLRVWLYRAIEPITPAGLHGFRTGDLLARIVADVDTMDGFFVRGVVPPVAATLTTLVASAVLGVLDPRLGLTLLVCLVLAGVALPLEARRRSRDPAARMIEARAELHAELAEDIEGLADLMACGRERRLGERLGHWSARMEREQRRLASVRGGSAAAAAMLTGLAGLAVLILVIPLVRGGGVQGLFLASVPLIAFAAFEAVQPLGDAIREIEVSRTSARRTFEVIDAPPVVIDPPEPLMPPLRPSIEFREVRFGYSTLASLVLDRLSFRLPAGGRIAITGPSGAGKTTIVGLLLRFWEAQSGSILVGENDLRRYRGDDVRALIGVVPQQIYLFNGTLRDNLLVADGEADDDRIARACDQAQLGEFLRSLPDGLDTLVGEDGLKLSGGERQRVAIARVFLKGAPILILDEATANLDAATEAEVLEKVRDFARNKTLLVISHRHAPLELADHVITLPAPALGADARPRVRDGR
jgi:ATP-binding cassette subfamily C protein CydC